MIHHKHARPFRLVVFIAIALILPGCAKKSVTEPDVLCGVSRSDLSGSVKHNPILFVHGTPTWSFDYRHLIKALSPQARCVAPDLFGFGLSDRPGD